MSTIIPVGTLVLPTAPFTQLAIHVDVEPLRKMLETKTLMPVIRIIEVMWKGGNLITREVGFCFAAVPLATANGRQGPVLRTLPNIPLPDRPRAVCVLWADAARVV